MPADPLQGAGLDCWEVCEHCGKVRVKTNVLLFHSEIVLVLSLFLFYSGRATGSLGGSKSRDLLFICYLREPALCFEHSPAACISPHYAWSRVFLLHFLVHALPMG